MKRVVMLWLAFAGAVAAGVWAPWGPEVLGLNPTQYLLLLVALVAMLIDPVPPFGACERALRGSTSSVGAGVRDVVAPLAVTAGLAFAVYQAVQSGGRAFFITVLVVYVVDRLAGWGIRRALRRAAARRAALTRV